MHEDLIKLYHKNLINSFKERGWNLYLSLATNFISEEDVEDCVLQGAEKNLLIPGVFYIVIPSVEEDANWEIVRAAMLSCVEKKRLPYFVDVIEGEVDENGNTLLKSNGVYIIDSVMVNNDQTVELIPDHELTTFLGIEQSTKGNIVLELHESAGKIERQLTLSKREEPNESNRRDN